jgi:hypothetical protein
MFWKLWRKELMGSWSQVDYLATAITWKVISKLEEESSISGKYWVQLGLKTSASR